VHLAKTQPWIVSLALIIPAATAGLAVMYPAPAIAQAAQAEAKGGELTRKPKLKVAPAYPDLARRMSITGTVRLSVLVAPNGTVKSSKPLGGHPILVNAAMDAMKQWKYEPAATESSGIVEFKFAPRD